MNIIRFFQLVSFRCRAIKLLVVGVFVFFVIFVLFVRRGSCQLQRTRRRANIMIQLSAGVEFSTRFLNVFLFRWWFYRSSNRRRRLQRRFNCELKAMDLACQLRFQEFVDVAGLKVDYVLQRPKGLCPLRSLFKVGSTSKARKVSCYGKNDGSSCRSTACFITKVSGICILSFNPITFRRMKFNLNAIQRKDSEVNKLNRSSCLDHVVP